MARKKETDEVKVAIYKQLPDRAYTKFLSLYKGNAVEGVKQAVVHNKLFPGDLAVTVPIGENGQLDTVRTIKHWAIYRRHGEVEVQRDTVGVTLTQTSYRYYREYMKYGRIKSMWYKIWRKR